MMIFMTGIPQMDRYIHRDISLTSFSIVFIANNI